MTVDDIGSWLERYERAWRSPGTAAVRELFTSEATYRTTPYAEPVVGLAAIEALWEAGRDGPDESFTMAPDLVAVDDPTAVVRVEVTYGDPVRQEYVDLWVLRFADDGRVTHFEEWPFWPGGTAGPQT